MDFKKDIERNAIARYNLLTKAKNDTTLQRAIRQRCREDPVYFINYFCSAFNPNIEPQNFPLCLYPAQEKLVRNICRDIDQGQNSVTEKSREWGATYIFLCVYLWYWSFDKNFEALLLSQTESDVDDLVTTSSLFGKLRYNLERLPKWLLPKRWNPDKHTKMLSMKNPETGSTITGRATKINSGRGARKKAILIDEHAWINPRIIEGLELNLRHVTRSLHRLSTPQGISIFKMVRDKGQSNVYTCHWTQIPPKCVGLYYYDDSKDQIECENLPYNQRSAYGFYIDEDGKITEHRLRSPWYDTEVLAALSPRDIAQELDISHLGSGHCRFNLEMLDKKLKFCQPGKRGKLVENNGTIIFMESALHENYELEVWEFPKSIKFYNRTFIGVDTAEGKENGDFSSADVVTKSVDGMTSEHVASLHGHFDPDVYAEKLDLLGRWYDGGATICVELNKDGLGVVLRLKNTYHYPHIFYPDPDKQDEPGFRTNKQNKFTITGDLDEALKTDGLKCISVKHLTEMSTFIHKGEKLEADGSNFDDRVISMALAFFVASRSGKPRLRGKASTQKIPNMLRTNTKGYRPK